MQFSLLSQNFLPGSFPTKIFTFLTSISLKSVTHVDQRSQIFAKQTRGIFEVS